MNAQTQNLLVLAALLVPCAVLFVMNKIALRKNPNPLMRNSFWMRLLS